MPFPSPDQARVIDHRGNPLIVVAGPGTGKTRTLVERMMGLLREDPTRQVTLVTFTRTSMRDTERKIAEELGEASVDDALLEFPRVSTLHTYAKRLVHKYGRSANIDPSFSIPIDAKGERRLVISDVIHDLALKLPLDEVSYALSKVRATDEWPHEFSASETERQQILERFDTLLQLYRTLDMEGVVLAACQILRMPDAHLPQLYLQVDEFQDLNPVDQEFIMLLSSHPASQIVVVGDDAQSIYSFRHANLAGVRSLWDSDRWERIRFPDSFRLPSHILNAALDLLGDAEYVGASLNRKPHNGKEIITLQCTSQDIQIEAIARDIQFRMQEAQKDPDVNLSFRDFLVLCPTRSQVRQVVSALNSAFGLPAHSPAKPSFPDDYWALILFLRMASSLDPLALRQWLTIIGFTDDEIADIRRSAIDSGAGFFDSASSLGDERLQALFLSIEAARAKDLEADSFLDLLQSVDSLTIPDGFPDLLRSWVDSDGELPALGTIVRFLYQQLGIFEADELVVSEDDRVLVATMHGAKGLEAAYVYCPWMSSTFMPLSGRDLDEQRRILYVALTRAKEDIVLTFPEWYDPSTNRRYAKEELSPFIEEISCHIRIPRITASSIRGADLPWHI